MKFLVNLFRPGRAAPVERSAVPTATGGDDTVGKGMEMAITLAIFLVGGILLDAWLGTSPLFTIVLLVLGAVGSFTQMRYAYEQRMQRLEAERRQRTGIDGHGFQWPSSQVEEPT